MTGSTTRLDLTEDEQELIRTALRWYQSALTESGTVSRAIRQLEEKLPPCPHVYTRQRYFCDRCGQPQPTETQ